MSLPRSVAEVLADHGALEVEGIDRMYPNVYRKPIRLQCPDGPGQQGFRGCTGEVCPAGEGSCHSVPQKGSAKTTSQQSGAQAGDYVVPKIPIVFLGSHRFQHSDPVDLL